MDEQTPYYFAFSMCYGIGPMNFSALIKEFKNPKTAFYAKEHTLVPILGEKLTKKLRTFRSSFNPIAEYSTLLTMSIQYLPIESPQYSNRLRSISDPPIGLFVIGNKNLVNSEHTSIAIVGTRQPSSYGEEIAKTFARDLATSGCTIVSGLAVGIDSFAHWGALDAQGNTIAVLGCGVDNIPASRAKLYKEIVAGGGAIVSEFPPGKYVQKGFFVSRNRIISGLADGVLVVEGTEKSGTLITAQYAANQGKDVFAPPVPLLSRLSQAPSILLKNGATFVTCAQDILTEYNLTIRTKKSKDILNNRPQSDQLILTHLLAQACSPNELAQKTNLTIASVLTIISMLEIEGIVKKNQEGNYLLCQP